MAADWMDRTIRGPASEYLTVEQLRGLFGLPAEWLDEQIEKGVIPGPIKLTKKTQLFTWEHGVYLSLWLKFASMNAFPAGVTAPSKAEK